MTPSISSILQQHTAAYPLMAPQDYGKLAYQNEFGPGHMISDKQAAFDFLLREWREAGKRARIKQQFCQHENCKRRNC